MYAMPILPALSPVGAKSLTARFDAGRLSSDGGLIVLREIERRLGLADTITGPLRDLRDPTRIRHSYAEMARARMLMIAAGYEDCDDVDTLRSDPALKIAVGRCPETGTDLMSQPTLSRLENLADWRALARIGLCQIDLYCRSFARPPTRIVLDIDDTDDPVHGQQELALFNAHYDCTCFQPIHIFDGLSGKPILSLLRPGKRPSGEEVAKVLRHVIRRIRSRCRGTAGVGVATHLAPLLRDAPAGEQGRRARDPGFVGTREAGHDGALHAGRHQSHALGREPARSTVAREEPAAVVTGGRCEASSSGGRGHLPRSRSRVACRQPRSREPRPIEGDECDRGLSHGGPRRPRRAL
jgi:hypothetical protein